MYFRVLSSTVCWSVFICIPLFRRKYSGKLKGYSELDEDGIYENIPIDASMFEVQTVAIDIGPEKSASAVYGKGVWRETTFSLSRQVHQYHNAVYEEMDIDKTEFETQTLKVDVGTDEVAKDVSYTKSILPEDTTSLSGLAFESQLMNEIYDDPFPGFFCTDAEEQEEIYEARYQNLINEEDVEDDYEDVFPNFPSDDAQRMTLELSPQKTVLVEGIFSEENKVNIDQGSIWGIWGVEASPPPPPPKKYCYRYSISIQQVVYYQCYVLIGWFATRVAKSAGFLAADLSLAWTS